METGARVLLIGLAAVVLIHYLNGGPRQAKKYLTYVFSGRVNNDQGWEPTGRSGVGIDRNGKRRKVPTQKRREVLPNGLEVETEIGIP